MNNNQRLEVVKISNWDESSKKVKRAIFAIDRR